MLKMYIRKDIDRSLKIKKISGNNDIQMSVLLIYYYKYTDYPQGSGVSWLLRLELRRDRSEQRAPDTNEVVEVQKGSCCGCWVQR